MNSFLRKSFVSVLLFTPALIHAGTKAKAPTALPAPLPPAITTSRTVFLSNLCDGDATTCTGIYNSLYAGLQAQGKYTLLTSPASADLVFEIHYSTKLTDVGGSKDSGPMSSSTSRLLLVIVDRATRVALWSIAEPEARKVRASDKVLADLNALTTATPPVTP